MYISNNFSIIKWHKSLKPSLMEATTDPFTLEINTFHGWWFPFSTRKQGISRSDVILTQFSKNILVSSPSMFKAWQRNNILNTNTLWGVIQYPLRYMYMGSSRWSLGSVAQQLTICLSIIMFLYSKTLHKHTKRRVVWVWNIVLEHTKYLVNLALNSLWPSDIIRRQRSVSTLAQVMACCLTAPSHYLNQCWLIISEVQWHSY